MSRALVLGGGGPLGVGWEAGVLTGLAAAGVDLRDADFVVGTSAGSIVGAQLTLGRPLTDLVARVGEAPPWRASAAPPTADGAEPPDLLELLASRTAEDLPSEEAWVGHFGHLGGGGWPETFHCTAFCLESGAFSLWDASAGVELPRAVASSCTIPGLVAPVIIGEHQWIDGGARDMLNADLAIGHDVVVALSCMVLDPPEGSAPELFQGLFPAVRQRIDDLRGSGSVVEVVEPSEEFAEFSGWGRYLMEVSRTAAAFEAGQRQAEAEAPRIAALWNT